LGARGEGTSGDQHTSTRLRAPSIDELDSTCQFTHDIGANRPMLGPTLTLHDPRDIRGINSKEINTPIAISICCLMNDAKAATRQQFGAVSFKLEPSRPRP
jgi:hypothetical protein